MAIRVALNHVTEYDYDRPVEFSPHVVRLRPAPHCRTTIVSYSLKVTPEDHFLNWQQDPYSNYLARYVFNKPGRKLRVEVDLVVEMSAINPFNFFVEEYAEKSPFQYDEVTLRELAPYMLAPEPGPHLKKLIEEVRQKDLRTIDYLVAINQKIQGMIKYVIRMEPGVQAPEETLEVCKGSCRDSAWLQVNLLRHLGFAARFVSGYLIQLTADEKSLDGPSGPTADFTDLHAWTEVYLPGAGWVGFDATSGLAAGEGHIPLACSAEPVSAAAISGSFNYSKDPSKGEEDELKTEFHFSMSVKRVLETPRVTLPYTDAQWAEILATGQKVEDYLQSADVRLTMGGEPTFVSIDDRDAPEWNTDALGDKKRQQAGELLRRMRDRFAPKGMLFFGQGKWYPGEQLPRWALGCYWRKDGQPVWDDPSLIAEDKKDYGVGPKEAELFIKTMAKNLTIDPAHTIPGYEDVWYYMWKERQLPTNVDPLKNKIEDEMERKRIAKIFDQGLREVVGHVLPIRRAIDGSRWLSGKWFLRRENLFLIPGDSPMGFRLPLDSLPWEAPGLKDTPGEFDPSVPRGPLPTRPEPATVVMQRPGDDPASRKKGPAESPALVRTALCVQARDGRLMVFLPPQKTAEDYLDLVYHVEQTAAQLNLPVQLEGYTPPSDARLESFQVTPDPGVIEVNVHPSGTWDELVTKTEAIYEDARQTRLCAEKFQVDGRHTGTGGGNHVIFGGDTPLDSPILRRPDLLRSLVAYWHNHPSLSYIFSGLFMGPTSQAPRLDEARHDSVYEMEIAFKQIPDRDTPTIQPWLVDRIFRHLLTDLTGNTHRAEFCIDKLYSPDSSSGRRGLLEFRSLEMPPHARMSLAQQLLMRSFVARFWKEPYNPSKLVRWGTGLHDRFLLPYFAWEDFKDVLDETRKAGFDVKEEWFAPHWEFRFPQIGELARHNINLELRTAIEPWNVLGEEFGGTGTARYVDSSVERVQVRLNGLTDTRHVLTVNERPVPLHPTGTHGEYVAGVRYRAWQPPSCLHPTIAPHAPLVFDLYDTWMKRAVGGCTYFVAHPGGLSHETMPVNANEAEGRRISRFMPMGHTPGSQPIPKVERHPEAPLTLDLRT
ncbi:transglutaminase family protein [Zavarzinella formosa]|uniref:transglutaminase family protein n=1 Tax=Zavarzinella formosa TaxID=360055 RepID=UPI0002FAC3CF|nr:transglutaminase family protein [Zavarzinella formosa]